MSVVVDAIASGNKIECDEVLPFREGERVRVSIERIDHSEPKRGSAEAIFRALRTVPPLTVEDVEVLKRSIAESKLQPSPPLFED
jgi:hypothetical protein